MSIHYDMIKIAEPSNIPEMSETTYEAICPFNIHEYYNNGYGKRCLTCGFMKLLIIAGY